MPEFRPRSLRSSTTGLESRSLPFRSRRLGGLLGAFVFLNGGSHEFGQRVNHPLALGEDVNLSVLSPDGSRAFYVVTQAGFDGGQLFSAPSDGSQTAFALGDPLPAGRDVLTLQVSPDGHWLSFVADADTAGQYELYGVPSDGSSPPVKLNDPLIPNGDVFQYLRYTPDSSRLLFLADGIQDGAQMPFSVAADGSAPPVLLATVSTLGLFEISPDGQTLVFRDTELYSVPIDGSASARMLSVHSGDEHFVADYRISPDGTRVVYGTKTFPMGGEEGVTWIFSVPIDGSELPTQLFDPLPEGSFGAAPQVRVSPDSQWVVYRTNPSGMPWVLQSAPIDGSSSAVLLSDSGGTPGYDFRFTSGGEVLFPFLPGGGSAGLYRIPVDGSTAAVQIVGAPGDPAVVKAEVTSLGNVVFVGFTGQFELFGVPLDGTARPVRLNPGLVTGGGLAFGNAVNVPSFTISPDEQWVVYAADQIVDERFELFAVSVDGSLPSRKLNAPLVPGGDVSPFPAFAGPSKRVVYSADQDEDQTYELFTTEIQQGRSGAPCARRSPGAPPGP